MPYLGRTPTLGAFHKLDDITASFNGVANTFSLTCAGTAVVPGSAQNLVVSLGGVLQNPGVAYTVNGSTIIFSTAPLLTQPFFGVALGDALDVGMLTNGAPVNAGSLSVSGLSTLAAATLSGNLTVGASKFTVAAATGTVTSSGTITVDSASSAALRLDRSSTSDYSILDFRTAGAAADWQIYTLNAAGPSLQFTSSAGAALTLTPAGAATFAGAVTSSGRLQHAVTAGAISYANAGYEMRVSNGLSLYFGSQLTAPYATWMQSMTTGNDAAPNPLALNPLGGGVSVGGLLTVSGLVTHTFGAAGTGTSNVSLRLVAHDGASSGPYIGFTRNTTLNGYVGSEAVLMGGGSISHTLTIMSTHADGLNLRAHDGSGAIRFYSGGTTLRGSFSANGNLNIAAGAKIYLDGASAGGNTYISEASADVIYVTTGSVIHLFGPSGFAAGAYPTTASAANVYVAADGNYISRVTSLRAIKYDIEAIQADEARRVVLGLQSVTYRSRVDDDKRKWPGLIAEDVEAVTRDLAMYDGKTGALQSVAYDRMPMYLLPVVQQHDRLLSGDGGVLARIAALEAENTTLRQELNLLKAA